MKKWAGKYHNDTSKAFGNHIDNICKSKDVIFDTLDKRHENINNTRELKIKEIDSGIVLNEEMHDKLGQMDKKVYCFECKKYFENIEKFNEEHNKTFYQVMKIKHDPLFEDNCLSYIANILSENNQIKEKLNKQSQQIEQIISKLNYYENAFKNDVTFECNINIKYIKNKINGRCILHFLPKSIQFKIEYKGNIDYDNKKELEIEIIFPFKLSELKLSTIEKLKGCILNHKLLDIDENQINIYHNYSSSIIQNNNITSIKLLKDFCVKGYFEQKSIDISINGILTYTNFEINFNSPLILFNINFKKFLCFENNKWIFIDYCFLEDGNIMKSCIINLELNKNSNEIIIKNKYNYIENKTGLSTTEKKDAIFNFSFFNIFYGIISIHYNLKYLSCNIENDSVILSNKENYFILYNI